MQVSKHIRKHALLFLCATFVLRALVPVGYMPAAWSDGLPFVLCPEGLPASVVDILGGHDHQHGSEEDASASDAADQCNFGHIVSSAFLLHDVAPVNLPIMGFHQPVAPEYFTGAASVIAYLPRGPPNLKQS